MSESSSTKHLHITEKNDESDNNIIQQKSNEKKKCTKKTAIESERDASTSTHLTTTTSTDSLITEMTTEELKGDDETEGIALGNEKRLSQDNEEIENTKLDNVSSSSSHRKTSDTIGEGRYCWVCFATDEEDRLASWVQPCKCSGTTKWVHQICLQRWVDEKQKGNSFKRVNCPQCQTEYIIVFPPMGTIIGILEGADKIVKRLSPFVTAGVIVGSLYWTAVTYGAITVLQVVGYKEGLQMMEESDPLVLLIGLPAIPVALVLGRMIRWEDMILKFLHTRQETARKFPLLNLLWPFPEATSDSGSQTNNNNNNNNNYNNQNSPIISESISVTRVFCGALLLPTISAFIGKMFFESIQNNLHRTLFGGLSFVMVKGVLKIYFKQKQYVRKKQRKILDFNEENFHRCGHHSETRQRNPPNFSINDHSF